MSRLLRLLIASVSILAVSACATLMGGTSYTQVNDGVLVGTNNMTLYTFAKDGVSSGKSVCNAQCALNWPPLLVEANTQASGDYSVIARDDGKKQLAYKGLPLYFWTKDVKPGDKTGDGRSEGAWKVAKL
jgi:predicted lipoprotein with Yx(FWY)xxD motif